MRGYLRNNGASQALHRYLPQPGPLGNIISLLLLFEEKARQKQRAKENIQTAAPQILLKNILNLLV